MEYRRELDAKTLAEHATPKELGLIIASGASDEHVLEAFKELLRLATR